jgi:hypothetical protein
MRLKMKEELAMMFGNKKSCCLFATAFCKKMI